MNLNFTLPDLPLFKSSNHEATKVRPPVPGYDMRTLRKQIEFLYLRIEESKNNQNQLIIQSKELWSYAQELQHSNNQNMNKMIQMNNLFQNRAREHHSSLNNLAVKLQQAVHSKQILMELEATLNDWKDREQHVLQSLDISETNIHNLQSNYNYLRQELVNETNDLRNQSETLENLRTSLYNIQNEDRADVFFYTNQYVLRSAFRLLVNRLRKRKEQKITGSRIIRSYQRYMKHRYLKTWKISFAFQKLHHIAKLKRDKERLVSIWNNWKIYTGLERLFRVKRNKRILISTFLTWKRYVMNEKREAEFHQRIEYFQNRRFLRKVLKAWHSTVLFLDWNNPILRELEVVALKHFVLNKLRAWRKVCVISSQRITNQVKNIQTLMLKRHLFFWKSKCLDIWKHRGYMLRDFFVKMRFKLIQKNHRTKLLDKADYFNSSSRMRIGFYKLYSFMKRNQASHLFKGNAKYFISSRIVREIRSTLHHWSNISFRKITQNRRLKASSLYYITRCRRNSFCLWRKRILERLRLHASVTIFIFQKYFNPWRQRTITLRQERTSLVFASQKHTSLMNKNLRKFILIWCSISKKRRRLMLNHDVVHQIIHNRTIQRMLQLWKTALYKSLYSKQRELLVETDRSRLLQELEAMENNDTARHVVKLDENIRRLRSGVTNLSQVFSDRTNELKRFRDILDNLETLRMHQKEKLDSKITVLKALREERDRVKHQYTAVIHSNLIKKAKPDSSIVNAQQINKMLRKGASIERKVADTIMQNKENLRTAINEAEKAEMRAKELQLSLDKLDKGKHEDMAVLETTRKQLKNLSSQGEALLDDAEQQLRKQEAELMVLKSNTGMTTARVREFKSIIDKYRKQIQKRRANETEVLEKTELSELSRLSRSNFRI